jgi:hypothetical protein
MTTRLFKRLPYGKSLFRDIILQGYAYVDKTRFIEKLENEDNPSHFFIRPRKFGKSTFLTMLRSYYDVNAKDEFEQIFGNLYIGKHPTPERNSYAIMEFDFSGLNTSSEEKFVTDFSKAVPGRADIFLQRNPLRPEVRYEWAFEIKYCKTSAKKKDIAAKRDEGLEQLKQYLQLSRIKDRPKLQFGVANLKGALLIFIGKNKFEIILSQNANL